MTAKNSIPMGRNSIATAITLEPVTLNVDCPSNPVFGIRGGLPLGEAFDQLTLLLSAAIGAIEATSRQESECNSDPTGTWCAVHTLNLVNDLVQSMHNGYIEHRKRLQG